MSARVDLKWARKRPGLWVSTAAHSRYAAKRMTSGNKPYWTLYHGNDRLANFVTLGEAIAWAEEDNA